MPNTLDKKNNSITIGKLIDRYQNAPEAKVLSSLSSFSTRLLKFLLHVSMDTNYGGVYVVVNSIQCLANIRGI